MLRKTHEPNTFKKFVFCLMTILFIALLFIFPNCKPNEPPIEPPEEILQRRAGTESLKLVEPGQVHVRFRPQSVNKQFTPDPKSKGLERLNLSSTEIKELTDLGLVQVRRTKPQLEIRENDQIRVLSDEELRERLEKKPRSKRAAKAFEGIEREMILKFPPQLHPEKICKVLTEFPSVESCTPSYKPHQLDPIFPDDPAFTGGIQWGFHNPAVGGPDQAPNFDIDAPEAWEIQLGDASVVIAVIDSDLDVRHRDLYEKIWINTNELPAAFVADANALSSDGWPEILTFIDLNAFNAPPDTQTAMEALRAANDLVDMNANGYIDGEDLYEAFADGVDDDPPATAGYADDIIGWDFAENDPMPLSTDGHGTAVAGLAAAMTNNATDIAGVGWNTRIMAVRYGSPAELPVEYAIMHGANIITSSVEPRNNYDRVPAVVESLEDEGIVFSASLGNIDRYIDGTTYARQPYVIAVSNYRSTGIRAFPSGSSYSVNTDVAAPGSGTYSLDIPEGTRWFGGTSGANPIVAGILSLMIAQRDGLYPEQIRQVLRKTAVDIPAVTGDQGENTPGFDYYSGWGLANAWNAIENITTDPWGEAKFTTQPVTYFSRKRREHLHIIDATSDVRCFAGDPNGGDHTVSLAHAPGEPPVSSGAWTTVVSESRPYLKDDLLTTLNRDDLQTGVNSIRLTVTIGEREFIDYGRVDVPHAYMDIKENTMVHQDFEVRGFAFHPQFARYELQAASGHDPDETNDSLWSTVGSPVNTEMPPWLWYNSAYDHPLFSGVSPTLLPNGEATLRLAVFNGSDERMASFSLPILVDNVNHPYQSGFPAPMGWPYRQGGAVAYDLTGDGDLELIVTEQVNIHAFKSNGTELDGWPASVGSLVIACSPAVGDVNGDGLPEIVVRATDYDTNQDTLYVFKHTGEVLSPWWPIEPPTHSNTRYPYVDHAPVLADLDGDGDLEILLSGSPADAGDAEVLAFQQDGGLWQSYGPPGATKIHVPPAVGDLNADGEIDVVVASKHDDGNWLTAWSADGSSLFASPVSTLGSTVTAVLLADLDADRDFEIVVLNNLHALRAYHHDGSVVTGWEDVQNPNRRYAWAWASISAGDFNTDDGQDTPQIMVSYYDQLYTDVDTRYGLYMINPDGTIPDEWSSVNVAEVQTLQQPTVLDVDNDGNMEVLNGPYFEGAAATFAPVYAFNHDATPVADDRYPIYVAASLPRAPVIADLDRDGDLEYAVASHSGSVPLEVFDLDANDDPGAVAWGMELHDPLRSSNYHGGIRILEPTTSMPTDVGPFADPSGRHLLLVRLKQELPSGTVDAPSVTVSINGIPATLVDFTRVEGEFWMLVVPPDQDAEGRYLLDVEWNDGGIRRIARQKEAVLYSAVSTPVDQVMVMDRSGSMLGHDKYLASRTAANFYVSARGSDDQTGVVSFHTQATDEIPGMLTLGPDGSANRSTVAGAITSVTPPNSGAMTSIGEGLKKALEDVLPAQTPNRSRALVLLSDGLENTAPFWDRGAGPVRELFERPENDDVVIHTIALGPDADRSLHDTIAEATGGTSRFVYLGSSLSLYGRLADAYKQVEEIIRDEQRIFTKGEDIPLRETRTYDVRVPQGALRASFAISYRDPGAVAQLIVTDPDGTPVPVTELSLFKGPSSCVATLSTPLSGTYQMHVTPLKQPTEVLSTVSVLLQRELFATLAWVVPSEPNAMEGVILAGVMDAEQGGLLHNSQSYITDKSNVAAPVVARKFIQLKVRIVAPDKSVTEIPLSDNGYNRDGEPFDGVHAVPYTFTIGGGYALTIVATIGSGESNEVIEKTIGYFQPRHRDRDLDGILDAWEKQNFAGVDIKAVHPLFDHDADGLNTVEETLYRTDPKSYDTDGDGIPDGLEVDQRTDPLKPDPAQPVDTDKDADGITDAWEKRYFRDQNPADVDAGADPDGDGLSNYTESIIGTNPTRYDSDGDGISDDTEYALETPKPTDRVWHPQPEKPVEKPNRDLIILLVILLIILLIFLVLYFVRRRP